MIDDMSVTLSLRICSVMSRPSRKTRNESGSPSRSISMRLANAVTDSASPGSNCASSTASATARYIEPVSMYSRFSARANIRPSVDLPDPDGPSIAMIVKEATQKPQRLRSTTERRCGSVEANRRQTPASRLYKSDLNPRHVRRAGRLQMIHDNDARRCLASAAFRETLLRIAHRSRLAVVHQPPAKRRYQSAQHTSERHDDWTSAACGHRTNARNNQSRNKARRSST